MPGISAENLLVILKLGFRFCDTDSIVSRGFMSEDQIKSNNIVPWCIRAVLNAHESENESLFFICLLLSRLFSLDKTEPSFPREHGVQTRKTIEHRDRVECDARGERGWVEGDRQNSNNGRLWMRQVDTSTCGTRLL